MPAIQPPPSSLPSEWARESFSAPCLHICPLARNAGETRVRAPKTLSESPPRKRDDSPKLGDRLLAQLAARPADFRKFIFPVVWPHGIENCPAVGVILVVALLRRHARIKRCRPAAVDDVDIGRRIDPRHHRP